MVTRLQNYRTYRLLALFLKLSALFQENSPTQLTNFCQSFLLVKEKAIFSSKSFWYKLSGQWHHGDTLSSSITDQLSSPSRHFVWDDIYIASQAGSSPMSNTSQVCVDLNLLSSFLLLHLRYKQLIFNSFIDWVGRISWSWDVL